MLKLLKRRFKNKLLKKRYQTLVNQINDLEENLKLLSDSDLIVKSLELQHQYETEQDLNQLLSQAFALTREASVRTLGLRHFDVQLLGGIVLHYQNIAEMKTGEGKTLVATLPSFLNALTKKGVHIITVNDYLANRDQISMGQIYRFLGLDTGLIQDSMKTSEKKENYLADITYVTNYEVTFDFLRDNMALNLKDVVLRPFHYCIIDEADSVLIDEAQTPLIISDVIPTPIEKYTIASEVTDYLELNRDYTIDEKNKNIVLTEVGSKQIEKILKIDDLYNVQNPWIPYIINAIKAKTLYFANAQYIIQKNKIVIVDEFTGRIMPDRRWADGLHQAMEAKEKLPIRSNTETIASITYQNFFLLYPKLSGMTGTGKTAEAEFEKIYKLSVQQIPTAKPNQRKDLPDLIYKDQFSKWKAIAETCQNLASSGQPILIGTKSVEKSELLAELLNEYQLVYQLLNAKPENVRRESAIIAQAGKKNTITIATNMAGRGTDIILGGNITFKSQKKLYNILTLLKTCGLSKTGFESLWIHSCQGISLKFISVVLSFASTPDFWNRSDVEILKLLLENERISTPKTSAQSAIRFLMQKLLVYHKKSQKQDNRIIQNLGGLYILGTERNDSRRIDNQLRGRAGRQGDPGVSRFFLSLEDTLLRLFGGSKIQNFIKQQMPDDLPLEAKFLTRSLDSAQNQIEERAYQARKNLFDYDEVLNKQRNIVYYERKEILEKTSNKKKILSHGEQIVIQTMGGSGKTDFLVNSRIQTINNLFGRKLVWDQFSNSSFWKQSLQGKKPKKKLKKAVTLYLVSYFWLNYTKKTLQLEVYETHLSPVLEELVLLLYQDTLWREHIQKLTLLRDAVGWRTYGQKNPLYEYRIDAFFLFQKTLELFIYVSSYEFLRLSIL